MDAQVRKQEREGIIEEPENENRVDSLGEAEEREKKKKDWLVGGQTEGFTVDGENCQVSQKVKHQEDELHFQDWVGPGFLVYCGIAISPPTEKAQESEQVQKPSWVHQWTSASFEVFVI